MYACVVLVVTCAPKKTSVFSQYTCVLVVHVYLPYCYGTYTYTRHMYTYMCTRTCVHVHIHVHTYTYTCAHTHVHVHVYVPQHVPFQNILKMYLYMHTYAYTTLIRVYPWCLRLYLSGWMYVYTCVYMYDFQNFRLTYDQFVRAVKNTQTVQISVPLQRRSQVI
jgi:hypothetical protein